MQRILLTGISGVGNSTVIGALAAGGHAAVDLDSDAYSEWVDVVDDTDTPGTPVEPGRDWVWRADRVQGLLAAEIGGALFVSGCSANMGQFLPQFDHVVLLSAPPEVIVARLAARTNNTYGQQPAEAARVLALRETVEPLLRRAADHEIDARAPLDEVVAAILRLADTPGQNQHT